MRRREALTVFGGAALLVARPLRGLAQAQTKPTIGFVRSTSAADSAHLVAALRTGLKEVGFADGENVVIEYRWADGNDERLPALVADLLSHNVAVLISSISVAVGNTTS